MAMRSTMKPRELVLVAAGLAMSVPLVLRLLRWATGEDSEPNVPAPPAPGVWRRLYRRNRAVLRCQGSGKRDHLGIGQAGPLGRPVC